MQRIYESREAWPVVAVAEGSFLGWSFIVKISKCRDGGGTFWRYDTVVDHGEDALRSSSWGSPEETMRSRAELSLQLLLAVKQLENSTGKGAFCELSALAGRRYD